MHENKRAADDFTTISQRQKELYPKPRPTVSTAYVTKQTVSFRLGFPTAWHKVPNGNKLMNLGPNFALVDLMTGKIYRQFNADWLEALPDE